jgi:hypothetical protein
VGAFQVGGEISKKLEKPQNQAFHGTFPPINSDFIIQIHRFCKLDGV